MKIYFNFYLHVLKIKYTFVLLNNRFKKHKKMETIIVNGIAYNVENDCVRIDSNADKKLVRQIRKELCNFLTVKYSM